MTTYSGITVESLDGYVEITLNRPERRNSLTQTVIEELIDALETVRQGEAFGVILASAGPVFCAGHDFDDMVARDLPQMRELMQRCSRLMQLIHEIPQTVVAAVQGLAVGAGCQLALTCDLAVAAEEAAFLTAGGTGGWFCFTPMVAVTRAVGRKRALEMLMTGERIEAARAAEWGIVNRVVPTDDLLVESRALMGRLKGGNQQMLGLGKQAFYAQLDLDEGRAYAYAAELMASTAMMPSPQARMRKFVARRAARVNGAG